VLRRLGYLTVTNTVAAVAADECSGKDIEILALRHQITVLERQARRWHQGEIRPHARVLLYALLTSLPREVLRKRRLLVRPDTILRWQRRMVRRRHVRTCRPKRLGRPLIVRSIRTHILRLVRENPAWGYRRVRG
jgi:putative transposase